MATPTPARTLTVTDTALDRKPTLRLAGKWLAAAGFEPGARVTVTTDADGRIIIEKL